MNDTRSDILEFLDNTGYAYEVLACDPALADTHEFCEHYSIPLANSANAILIKSKKGEPLYALCVLLATHRLDVNHTVKKKLGAGKVSFASAEETRDITKMEIGGVTPIGLAKVGLAKIGLAEKGLAKNSSAKNDLDRDSPTTNLPLWVDEAVMQCEYIILGGGSRSTKLKVSPQTLLSLPNVEIVGGLANLIPNKNEAVR